MYKQEVIISAGIVLVALIIVSTYFYTEFFCGSHTAKEKFDPKYETNKDTYQMASFTDPHPEVISNGSAIVYKEGGRYTYEFFFNLPDTVSPFQTADPSKQFNEKLPEEEYVVYAGITKKEMKKLGSLKRGGDGVFRLTVKNEYKFNVACATLGDSVVACIDIK